VHDPQLVAISASRDTAASGSYSEWFLFEISLHSLFNKLNEPVPKVLSCDC